MGNTGVTQENLAWVYVTGGCLTLVGAPLIGRLADRLGKLPVYRVGGERRRRADARGDEPSQGVPWSSPWRRSGSLMLCNAGRMGAGLAIVTGSVEPRRRGGFMSANSAVQHLASGLGAFVGGKILVTAADRSLVRFGWVGVVAAAATLLSLWLAGLVRSAGSGHSTREPEPWTANDRSPRRSPPTPPDAEQELTRYYSHPFKQSAPMDLRFGSVYASSSRETFPYPCCEPTVIRPLRRSSRGAESS